MKKSLIFLLTLLVASSVIGQTFEESQKLVSSETVKLEKRLNEVKDRIFYLEVTLVKKISNVKAPDLEKLEKEKYFSVEDLKKLKEEKVTIEGTLSELKLTGLSGLEYRTKSDQKSNIPQEISVREFNRRSRAQSYRALESSYNGTNETKKLEGILINYKTGRNDVLSFLIYRVDVKSKPIGPFLLNPKERLNVDLLPGKYNVEISDGARIETKSFPVDPMILKHADGKTVYWFACGDY